MFLQNVMTSRVSRAFIYTYIHRHSVTTVNCALEEHLLTYLLTYLVQCVKPPMYNFNMKTHSLTYSNKYSIVFSTEYRPKLKFNNNVAYTLSTLNMKFFETLPYKHHYITVEQRLQSSSCYWMNALVFRTQLNRNERVHLTEWKRTDANNHRSLTSVIDLIVLSTLISNRICNTHFVACTACSSDGSDNPIHSIVLQFLTEAQHYWSTARIVLTICNSKTWTTAGLVIKILGLPARPKTTFVLDLTGPLP